MTYTGTPYAELTPAMIEEGEMLVQLGENIRDAAKLTRRHLDKTRDKKAKAVIILKIDLTMEADQDNVAIECEISKKTPKLKTLSYARFGDDGERLMCQMEGSSQDDPDQMLLSSVYNKHGIKVGELDKRTGEVVDVEEMETVARIGG